MKGPGVTDAMRPCSMRTIWSALSMAMRKLVLRCFPRLTRFASPFVRAARFPSMRCLPFSSLCPDERIDRNPPVDLHDQRVDLGLGDRRIILQAEPRQRHDGACERIEVARRLAAEA